MSFHLLLALSLAPAVLPTLDAPVPEARRDIISIRHGDAPVRQQFLGWSEDGAAVFRSIICNDSAAFSCEVDMHRVEIDGHDELTAIWSIDEGSMLEDFEDEKGPISTEDATRFIRAEASAFASLEPLRHGTELDPSGDLFGEVAGEGLRVYIRTIPHHEDDVDTIALRLAVAGPRGVSIDLADLADNASDLSDSEIVDARLDPSGQHIVLAMRFVDSFMCWEAETIAFARADVGNIRAKVANAAGLRAYRAGELDEAYGLFREATEADDDYAWGWYNRAAVESLRGETEQARASLDRSVDRRPDQRARACQDTDFAALNLDC